MSLLLEALKKAEQAKRDSGTEQPSAPADERPALPESSAAQPAASEPASVRPDLDTRQEPVITRASLPDINQPLEIDPGEFAAAPRRAPPAADSAPRPAPPPRESLRIEGLPEPTMPARDEPVADQQPARDAARQLFDVKEVDFNPRRPFYITVGVLAVAAVGYGGYVWWQLQPRYTVNTAAVQNVPKGPPSAAPAPPPSPAVVAAGDAPAQAEPAPAQAGVAPAGGTPARDAAAPAARQSTGAVPAPSARPAAAAPAQAPAPPAAPPRLFVPSTATQPGAPAVTRPAAAAAARAPAASQPALQAPIAVTPPSVQPDETLERAYADFQRGDLNASRGGYERVLTRDPSSRDALLGLAAIDVRSRNFETAVMRYQRLLELDPRDAAAQTGLIALTGAGDPVQAESRLKTMLATQPDSPQLQFTLGNQYAAQGRWSEAQEAYFKAFSADEGNPDYSFNLAVSLDHLRQTKLALEYYRKAVALAGRRVAAFDLAGAQRRVRELER